ncbi:MAG TPA: SDR family NAD(P)-dependent oxidoreductase [Candidatus Methylomirabilis sp.]|nr:SDR family NAD(P)-dependent oxidoreductase [Candidatus Methylomirabilis sp.]
MKLADRVALVTGGGSGIGRAIAQVFAEEGARVIVNDIKLATAKDTLQALGPARSRGRAIQADVADSGQVKAMFAEIEREIGTLDVLVNNAGIAETSPSEREKLSTKSQARMREMMSGRRIETHWDVTQEMTDEAWTRMLAVHLNGTFFCTREALRIMSRQNRGVIVNMSSVAAWGLETVPHYSAAKGGILAFTRAVAREVASRGIRVNAICPGYIDTPMTAPMGPLVRAALLARTPLQRTGDPREVAQTALFLASDDGAFYTGQWLSPNGGLHIG